MAATRNERNNWIELFSGMDVSGWNPLIVDDPGSMIKEEMSWMSAGSVVMNSEDNTRFDIQPGEGFLVNGYSGRTSNIYSTHLHGDCELHIEFMVPAKSNSGVYFMGKYEIQILDSWGTTELRYGTCGGIYAQYIDEKDVRGRPPRVNASKPPGEWQSYDVLFHAPRFDENGRKLTNAVFRRVVWNGVTIHEEAEVEGPTRASMPGPEKPEGPLMLQGDHGPVAYRNIRIRPI